MHCTCNESVTKRLQAEQNKLLKILYKNIGPNVIMLSFSIGQRNSQNLNCIDQLKHHPKESKVQI